MLTIFYITPTCFGATTSPSSESGHQNFFKTYNNKLDHNKQTYVVASIVEDFISFG